jgi:hypothetical protein
MSPAESSQNPSWSDCPVGGRVLAKQEALDRDMNVKLDLLRDGVDKANTAITELNQRVLDPDSGLVVKVTDIARWRKAVDKALWIIFGILATAVLGGFFGWLVERASQIGAA